MQKIVNQEAFAFAAIFVVMSKINPTLYNNGHTELHENYLPNVILSTNISYEKIFAGTKKFSFILRI